MGVFRRFLERFTESDEERLAESFREWAASIPGATLIADAPSRTRVRIASVVTRISVVPGAGGASLEAVLTDGTGEVTAVWTGRVSIPGMKLGVRVLAEGVIREERDRRVMVNPAYEFASADL